MNEMRIAELRRHRGWTQERLAEASGIAVRTVQRIERGSDASLESLSSIASALEVPVRELFAVDDAGERTLGPEVRGLDERTSSEQAQRDAFIRGWQHLYTGVGVLVTLAAVALVATDVVPWIVFLVVPAYWAAGSLLSRFLKATVLDPWLDRRYPLSRVGATPGP
jgi:transcriptional regulator with XRE-family HTH domain